MSEAIAERPSQVPQHYYGGVEQIGAEDIAPPRVKIGQYMTAAVQEGLIEAGQVFTEAGRDDPDPQVIADNGEKVRFYVLGLRKGKSFSVDGDLETYDYDDPAAPADAWTTYTYFIALPSVDEELPHKFLLTRTGRPAAQKINLVLKKLADQGPPWQVAFELSTTKRENAKGKYFIAQVNPVAEPGNKAEREKIEAERAVAAKLAEQLAPQAPAPRASGSEPAI